MAIVINPPAGYAGLIYPWLFLAGPIQDAPDWQAQVCEMLDDMNIVIANPRTPPPWHGDFEKQVDWETNQLWASDVVLFWLANPAEQTTQEGRSYAQTSRFELGEWFSHAQRVPRVNLVVGIEPGFYGERYIRRRAVNTGLCHGSLEIHSTLEATVNAARRKLERLEDRR